MKIYEVMNRDDITFTRHNRDSELIIFARLGDQEIGNAVAIITGERNAITKKPIVRVSHVRVDHGYRRRGIATALYDYIERQGYEIWPSEQQTDDGKKFWANRHPGYKNLKP